MSGIDDSSSPPEVPEEYAAVYRDAYLRAMAEGADSPPEPSDEVAPNAGAVAAPVATERPGASWRRPVLVAVVVLAVVGGAVGIVQLVSGDEEPSKPGVAPPATSSTAPSRRPGAQESDESEGPDETESPAGAGWDGSVEPVAITEVEASCTADPGVDSAGKPVRYAAGNTVDGDPTTAWRCDGRATGETLTFTLPPGTEVAELGLIPGYAKTDASSGTDRYAENNRITRVRWTLDDGVEIEQDLDPSPQDRGVQRIRVPRTESGTVTVEVLSVRRGPRNTTAISEVEVAAAD